MFVTCSAKSGKQMEVLGSAIETSDKIQNSAEIIWDQGGITCGAIDEPRKSSKAIDERVIINFCGKNVVIARFRDKNVVIARFCNKNVVMRVFATKMS